MQFSLTNTRKAPGLPVWTAPQGATVAGGCTAALVMAVAALVMAVVEETCKKYVFDHPIGPDSMATTLHGDEIPS